MATKQEQLEWVVAQWSTWESWYDEVYMSKFTTGHFISITDSHHISHWEWLKEKEKGHER